MTEEAMKVWQDAFGAHNVAMSTSARDPRGMLNQLADQAAAAVIAAAMAADKARIVELREELEKIAEQVGEEGDPFAAWEAIDAITQERNMLLVAMGKVARAASGSHAVAIAHEVNRRISQLRAEPPETPQC